MSLQKLQRIIREQERLDPGLKARHDRFKKEWNNIFKHMIYVTPRVYKFLVTLNISIPNNEIDTYEDKYLIFTKPYHYPTRPPMEFYTSKKNASAIRQLVKNDPQFMFTGREGARYKDGQLTINRIIIDVSNNPDRSILCELLFSWGRKKKKVWELDELDEHFTKQFDDPDERHDFYRGKVRYLNEAIFNATGLREFVVINANSLSIHPVYRRK